MGRRTILLVAAVVIAALGTAMVFLYVRSVDDRAVEGKKLVSIIYAKDTIPEGMSLQQAVDGSLVGSTMWPADHQPEGAIGDPAPLLDKVTVNQIVKNEPILETMLGDASDSSGFDLAKTETAVAVNLPAAERLAGVLQPKDWVFLYDSADGSPLLNGEQVQVLQIGNSTTPTTNSDQNSTADQGTAIVLLRLTRKQAPDVVRLNSQLYFALASAPLTTSGSQS